MFFASLLASNEQREHYRALLQRYASYLAGLTERLVATFEVVHPEMGTEGELRHATVLMLARHFISTQDGAAVLVAQGCSEPAGPLLRSAFEARLGIGYILTADHERRAIAYQVAHIHRKLKIYRRFDGKHELGRALRAELAGDEHADVLDRIPEDTAVYAARLEPALRRPAFVPVEAEWQAAKNRRGKEPNWFSLFGGPKDIKDLAKEMEELSTYWFLYKHWSDVTHAGSGMENVAMTASNEKVIRPLRHPEELKSVVQIITGFSNDVAVALLTTYRPDLLQEYHERFAVEMLPTFQALTGDNIVFPPWR
jgi:hypothetical protein